MAVVLMKIMELRGALVRLLSPRDYHDDSIMKISRGEKVSIAAYGNNADISVFSGQQVQHDIASSSRTLLFLQTR